MIYFVSGTPGSGKSLWLAKEIVFHSRKGIPIIANFAVNTDNIRSRNPVDFTYLSNKELSPVALTAFADSHWSESGKPFREGGIKLFIDEAQLLFNARAWNARGREDWVAFFTVHRKLGFDIYLVSQFDKMIDKQIRSLFEYEYKCKRLSRHGTAGWLLSILFGGELFCAVQKPFGSRSKDSICGRDFYLKRKKYYCIYDSYDTFGAAPS